MLPALNIGPLVIPTGVFALLIGAWVALAIVERAAPRVGGSATRLYSLATTMLFAGLVGARLTFVFLHWEGFRQNLLGIIWPLNSGYELWGGLLFSVAAAYFIVRRDQLDLAVVFDALVPGLLTLLIFASLADFLAGSGFGQETTVPWGLRLFDLPVRRHPVQVYEMLAGIVALASWVYLLRLRGRGPAGPVQTRATILLPTAIYAFGRLFVEAFKANSATIGDGWRLVQIICFVVLVVTLFMFVQAAPTRPVEP